MALRAPHPVAISSVLLAFDSLRAHKLRAFLTLLGVIIGVAAVIGMMAIIQGVQQKTEREMTILQSSVFQVQKWPMIRTEGGNREEQKPRRDIVPAYAAAIRERCSAVSLVGPEVWEFGVAVAAGGRSTEPNFVIAGATPEFFPNNGYFISNGRAVSYADVNANARVAVIGAQAAEELFPHVDPVGQAIRVTYRPGPGFDDDMGGFSELAAAAAPAPIVSRLTVIGVIEEVGPKFMGRNEDNRVAIPFSTFEELYGKNRSINITIQARSPELVPVAMDQVTEVMRRERGLRPNEENDFEFYSTQMSIDFFNNMTRNIKAAAIAICAMSLLVAGIGIMNIMLVSVRERTREIGVRKAIGARRRDILLQFVTEAVVLSEAGGVIGVLVGIGLAALAARIVPQLEAVVPVWAVLLGLVFCSLVGLFFGIYPAVRAARLDPILALRDE